MTYFTVKDDSMHDSSISLIRLISLILIVLCHVFQYYNFFLAWWFNVGVQIFLTISGYLFGQKKIISIKDFYRKRLKKILLPFYLVLIPIIVVNLLFKKITIVAAIESLMMKSTFPGTGHLWFVPTILLCYVITPILSSYFDDIEKNRIIIVTIVSIILACIICFGFTDTFNGAWIGCYIIGYALGVIEKNKLFSNNKLLVIFGLLSSMNLLQIYIENVELVHFSGKLETFFNIFSFYNHVWLGVFLFLGLKSIFDRIPISKWLICLLSLSDSYSYEIFLVHLFFILGPFSLMSLTRFVALNYFIVLFSIMIFTYLLKLAENTIMKYFHVGAT